MINWFRNFGKKEETNSINIDELSPDKLEYDISVPVNRIMKHYDKKKKNIVIIDDSRGIVSVLEDFLIEVEKTGNINIEDYNILTFYDKYAPFVLKKTLEDLGVEKIDYAIVDIVLPGKLREHGVYQKLDGIDVSILLNKEYKCNNLCFFTGNVVSEHVAYIKDKVIKFNEIFDGDIRDYIIFKGDNDGEETIKKLSNLFTDKEYILKEK